MKFGKIVHRTLSIKLRCCAVYGAAVVETFTKDRAGCFLEVGVVGCAGDRRGGSSLSRMLDLQRLKVEYFGINLIALCSKCLALFDSFGVFLLPAMAAVTSGEHCEDVCCDL